jgi:hypothetical protein
VGSKVGGSGTREAVDAGIQTDGRLVLLEGLTLALHMKGRSQDDVVLKADLSGEGQRVEMHR